MEYNERTLGIERSLTTEFHRSILSRFHKAAADFRLIENGDRICVCISGGKDSMLTAKLMQEYKQHSGVSFELEYLMLDPGYDEENMRVCKENLETLGIPAQIRETNIFCAAYRERKNPCFLCARIRRAELFKAAKEMDCNKIALGHHFDDVIETTLMGMIYGGQMQTMLPRRKSEHFEGIELIRPLYYVREEDILSWCGYNELKFIRCACRMTENADVSSSKRQEIKKLIAELRKINPQIESNIFRSAENVNVENLISYKDENGLHSFMDKL
ncbi:MAG: ATP-binding protein [Oscillospiraceae bacterium]